MNIPQKEFDSLFEGCSKERIEWFIDKMEQFYQECSTNQQGDFIRQGIFGAKETQAKMYPE